MGLTGEQRKSSNIDLHEDNFGDGSWGKGDVASSLLHITEN